MDKLESLALHVIRQLASAEDAITKSLTPQPISLLFANRTSTVGQRRITFPRKTHQSSSGSGARELAMLLQIVNICQDAISRNVTVTKRDIYYRDVALFKTQVQVDRLVDDLAATLGVTRAELHTCASSKGLFSGNLRLKTKDDEIISARTRPALIPVAELIGEVIPDEDVQFILVIEKEAVFNSLISVDFPNDPRFGKSVMITGKGYPDLASRQLLSMLATNDNSKHIPILVLVDCDPHGIEILSVYKFGSQRMAFQAGLAVEKVEWVGVKCSEWERLSIDPRLLLPLTAIDRAKAEQLKSRKDLPSEWLNELSVLLETGLKAEIQVLLSNHSTQESGNRSFQQDDGLVQYLLQKIVFP
ncbi:hypothetical protein CROQUDRAFT_670968 [Cronartium quercuum f. sp. fusiforme G11]|uniref:DNA topoisomerase (ATP-hydrolyzing) n=1 Tax=Cronartium quercuum f. sp. fusiforme G11 TaxID=708437 RepID=A0A9P6NIV6_9BASI|nr:hypothetical protein CROQUDRAFT_670968 [Cronartium quercuum f. sp. fusiforme G11]